MEVVASLSQDRTAAAQCGLFTHNSVPLIFEPPCSTKQTSVMVVEKCQLGTIQGVVMAALEFSRRESFKLYTFLSSAPL